jgi:undecaprenyl-diphosphatase
MPATVPRERAGETSRADDRGVPRGVLLGLALLRGGLYLLAIPLVPALYRDHAAVLVLLRPSKEVLLFAGFGVRRGDIFLPVVVLAAVPLLIGAVWVFFGLGRAYGDGLGRADLPGIAGRVLPRRRLHTLRQVVAEDGARVVFLGRLAVFPSTLVAAAAGAAGMPWRRFVIADGAGALLSLGVVLGIGFALEDTYEEGGPWLTGGGLVVVAAAAVLLGRSLAGGPRGRR